MSSIGSAGGAGGCMMRFTCLRVFLARPERFSPFPLNRSWNNRICTSRLGGPGSSVGIATDYGLHGPGSNPGGDEIFCPSRPALGPTQPPIKWVPSLSRG